jgi:hypothetical protein
MRSKPPEPWALKHGFSDKEWTLFQTRLTHAKKAIEQLMERAPELFEQLSGQSAVNPKTHELSTDYQAWIDTVVNDLFSVQRRRPLKVAKATLTNRSTLKLVPRRKR